MKRIENGYKYKYKYKNLRNRCIVSIFFIIIMIGIYFVSAGIYYKVNNQNALIESDKVVFEKAVVVKDNLTIVAPLIIDAPKVIVNGTTAIDSNYSVCINFNKPQNICLNWCKLIIKKGLITGCET